MQLPRKIRANCFSLVVFAAACGGSTQAPPPPPPDAAHFTSAAASAFCGSLSACCAPSSLPYDASVCTAQLTAYFDTYASSVGPTVLYNADAAASYIASLKAREARCADDALPRAGSLDLASPRVFIGTIDPGQPCKQSSECAPDPDPTIDSTPVCEGTCVLFRNIVPVGGHCQKNGGNLDECANGLSCAITDTQTCPDFVALGAPCAFADVPCAINTRCDVASTCSLSTLSDPACRGTCIASQPEGATCKTDGECGEGLNCFSGRCIVHGAFHMFDISRRSCSLGPLTNGLDDGSLISPQ